VSIIRHQPPAGSAMARELHPEDFDRTREVQVLELLAVLIQHVSIKLSNPLPVYDVEPPRSEPDFPETYPDLFAPPKDAGPSEEEILAGIADFAQWLADTTTD
jgi:hypothetical protein